MKLFGKAIRLSAMALCLCLTACDVSENKGICVSPVSVMVVPAILPGVEIDPDDIETVRLYIFDNGQRFLEAMDVAIGQKVMLDYRAAGNLHVVAVGNAAGRESVSTFNGDGATHLSHGTIGLIPRTRSGPETVHHSPGDLFWGNTSVVNDRRVVEEKELPMSRVVAQAIVRTIELREFARAGDNDFHYEIVSNFSRVSFTGEPSGEAVAHKMYDCRATGNVIESPMINLFSSQAGDPIAVRIYHGADTLIDTITKDSDGNPLVAINGKLLNVLIDYTGRHIDDGNVAVTIEYSGWGDPVEIGKDI